MYWLISMGFLCFRYALVLPLLVENDDDVDDAEDDDDADADADINEPLFVFRLSSTCCCC